MNQGFYPYPLSFHPIYKERLWGGNAFGTAFCRDISSNVKIGESWEISALNEDVSVVSSGPLKGCSLFDLCEGYPEQMCGRGYSGKNYKFPLLYKFLDAAEKLSVQVHPDAQYAVSRKLGANGKTEAWYVVWAKPGAKIIAGLKPDVTVKDIETAAALGQLESKLDYLDIFKGDVVFIPSGTVHAVLGGALIYEIQEPSDVTFRLFDWNRLDTDGKPRKLHMEDALAVIRESGLIHGKAVPVILEKNACYTHLMRLACREFALEEFVFNKPAQIDLPQINSFRVITVINGNADLRYPGGRENLVKGQTVLLPAALKKAVISASIELDLLMSYLP